MGSHAYYAQLVAGSAVTAALAGSFTAAAPPSPELLLVRGTRLELYTVEQARAPSASSRRRFQSSGCAGAAVAAAASHP